MADLVASKLRQINLYNPSLIPTREVFSARLIVAWVIVAAIAMAAVAWWAVIETRKVNVEIANQALRQAADRARTVSSVPPEGEVLPTPQQLATRQQALRSQQAQLESRRALRDVLKRGTASDVSGPSAIMRVIATTAPSQAWLTEIRVSGSRVDISGRTYDPASVTLWLDRLRASGHLAAKPQSTVRVERADVAVPTPGTPPPVAPRTPPVYTFGIVAALSAPFADDGGRP